MNTSVRRALTAICAAGTAFFLAAGTSYAGGNDCHQPPPVGGQHPGKPTDSGFYQLDSTAGSTFQLRECGALITVTVKVDKVKERDLTYQNGDVKSLYKGSYVYRLSNDKNAKSVTLDDSGPYTEVDYASGAIYLDLNAPAIIYPFTKGDKAAFQRAGLPPLFYYAKGTLKYYEPTPDRTYVLKIPDKIVSVCKLLGLPDRYGSGPVDAS